MERQFFVPAGSAMVEMFEQYLIFENRAIAMMCPAPARAVAESLSMLPLTFRTDNWFEARFAVVVPAGCTATESLTIQRYGTRHSVVSTHGTLGAGSSPSEWYRQQVDELVQRRPQAKIFSEVPGLVLNQFDGQVVTARWYDGGVRMLARRGLATVGDRG